MPGRGLAGRGRERFNDMSPRAGGVGTDALALAGHWYRPLAGRADRPAPEHRPPVLRRSPRQSGRQLHTEWGTNLTSPMPSDENCGLDTNRRGFRTELHHYDASRFGGSAPRHRSARHRQHHRTTAACRETPRLAKICFRCQRVVLSFRPMAAPISRRLYPVANITARELSVGVVTPMATTPTGSPTTRCTSCWWCGTR